MASLELKNIFLLVFILLIGCTPKQPSKQFVEVSTESKLVFENTLVYTEDFNPYTYRNFYNGAGVALGDVNNDGLLDVYFTGNIVDNKLFLNKGNWSFEDVTEKAGVGCPGVWSAGATFVDINNDGYLDLYVCKSGKPEGKRRFNELFINNGDGTFREESKRYGLDIVGLSTHAAFFDFDKDGDQDVYILNNSIRPVGVGFDLKRDQRNTPDAIGGNKFLRNDDGKFTDISKEAGVYTSAIGFGLGITLGDFNDDGWGDIFISNDFFERDYLYLNNQKGGFAESAETNFGSLSMGSMGADVGDLDNDGRLDLMVTEMLPDSLQRKRTKTMFESWDKQNEAVRKGYHYQYSRNVLQRNVGDGFQEVGRFSNVAASEWSWGALVFDLNNDGLRDIFVSNGIYKDLLDRDYLTFMANEEQVRAKLKEGGDVIMDLINVIPSQAVPNYTFLNEGNFNFTESSKGLGLGTPSFSNGAAYGDLDNDGDLDLVVNNVNMPSFVYRNELDTSKNRSVQFRLIGTTNTSGIGVKAVVWVNGESYMAENYPSRGFQSSVQPWLHFGLGETKKLDSVSIFWPQGKVSKLYNLNTNALYEIKEMNASTSTLAGGQSTGKKDRIKLRKLPIETNYKHRENAYVDFDRERLLFQMYSNLGPKLAEGDINADGILDFFVGGAKSNSSMLAISNASTYFNDFLIVGDSIHEDSQSIFVDIDGDDDLDLIVGSGGRAFSKSSSAIQDRVYVNNGNMTFSIETERLPADLAFSTSTISSCDIDNDGDVDLFIGHRFHPFYYGQDGGGKILINDGNGFFTTSENHKAFSDLGMVTDSHWVDLNGDGVEDLVVIGDWTNISVFENSGGNLKNVTAQYGLDGTRGWWNDLEVSDLDGDGDFDLIVGNHGLNSFFKNGTRMYLSDFDKNGTPEHIICHKIGNNYYPIADRDELVAQMPYLKKQLLYYKDYSNMSISDIFSEEQLSEAKILDVDILASSVFTNVNGRFERTDLPAEAQYSPLYAIVMNDVNKDGFMDLIVGGNQYLVKPQFGRYDALSGLILLGSEQGYISDNVVFLDIEGQTRDISVIDFSGKKIIIFAMNNDKLQFYEIVD